MKTLGQSLSKLLTEIGIDKKVSAYKVISLWPQIVGPKIDMVAKPDKVEDATLYLKVKSMAWRTELLFLKPEILKKIENTVGKDVIKEIRFY